MNQREARREALLEDLTFLADNGVGASEAARRCGFPSREALEKWCGRHARQLGERLCAHEPRDHNKTRFDVHGVLSDERHDARGRRRAA